MHTKFRLEILKGRDHSKDRSRWEDNIKIDRRVAGLDGADWIHLAQDNYR
jgi:hypothetical protein